VISLGTPRSARENFGCAWEHLGAPTTSLGAPTTSLGAPTTSLGAPICYGGFLVPIINTIFIELSTAAYPNISFSPRLILRLNFSFLYNENSQSKPIPQIVPSVDINQASSSNHRSSENSSNGNKPVFRYRNTR